MGGRAFRPVGEWLICFLFLQVVWTAPTVDLADPLSLGTCTCDLTQAQCDVNCCCDPDCDSLSSLVASFSCLPEGPSNASRQYCYSQSWLHSVNPRVDLWVVADDLRGLLCVSVDNSAVQGEVFENQATISSSQVDAVIQERRQTFSAVLPAAATVEATLRGYLAGDVLKIHSALSTSGQVQSVTGPATLESAGNVEVVRDLQLPTADLLGNCASPGQNVRFLNDVPSTTCWNKGVDLATTCTQLGPRSRLGTFLLRSQHMPQDLRCGSRCLLPDLSSSCPVETILADGSVVTELCSDDQPELSTPVLQIGTDSCTCIGAVKDIHYTFGFGLDETDQVVRISKMRVRFTLQNIVSHGCGAVSIPQGASATFVQDQADAAQVSDEERSGNPGYVAGLPLLVAPCDNYESDGTCAAYGDRRSATVPGILSPGTCQLAGSNATAESVVINFGENAMFGCTLSLTRSQLASLCRPDNPDMQNGFVGYLAMLPFGRSGQRWTHIAAFGNVPNGAQDPADWIEVEELARTEVLGFGDSTSSQQASNSTCTGAVIGVDLEVIYSYFGDVQNPQSKVVGARMSHRLGILSYTLPDPTARQSFAFGYSVTFLRRDEKDFALQVPPRPQLPVLLPADLFYPFTIGVAARPVGKAVLTLMPALLLSL
mmetsp:Transcript_32116/g.73949  ORF Transcript_32116/g.73949 Transcript_32116/m.73949 type:complete len:656 (-) Transcript_32116:26-1993(-)